LICTHDLQGQLLWVNPAAEKVSGYTAEQLMGTNLRDYLTPDTRDQFDDYLAEIEREGEASGLMHVVARPGEHRIWEYHNSLRVEGVGAPTVRGTARDITERKRMEETLKLKMEQLATLSQASQAVTASLEPNRVLAEIVSLASEVVPTDYTSVVLVDEAGNTKPEC